MAGNSGMVFRSPSTRPSPQGDGECSAVSLKNLRLDLPVGQPDIRKRDPGIPLPGGEDAGEGGRKKTSCFGHLSLPAAKVAWPVVISRRTVQDCERGKQ